MFRTIHLLMAFFLLGFLSQCAQKNLPEKPVNLILVTLDTTRADALGCYGGSAKTPFLDRLAKEGIRYDWAIAPSPMTLPSHATIMTGKTPPQHGLRDNGYGKLDSLQETLASKLRDQGFETAAFVASKILDKRFGLDQGFDYYDDMILGENEGEYGYPERQAPSITSAFSSWLSTRKSAKPFFVWLHFYDAHSPYLSIRNQQGNDAYFEEIERVDTEIGKTLALLPATTTQIVIAGDHGEMLGEHGEATHGVFLYNASLHVPLILSGPLTPANTVENRLAALTSIKPTLMKWAGLPVKKGDLLPGIGEAAGQDFVYSESLLPASAYGWSPLQSITTEEFRFILAPEPELYRYRLNREEKENLFSSLPEIATRFNRQLQSIPLDFTEENNPDFELLQSLGYSSGQTRIKGTLDPKTGMELLEGFQEGKMELALGNAKSAITHFERILSRNPDNVPFLNRLAQALAMNGQNEEAEKTYQKAIYLNPRVDFLYANLAEHYLRLENWEKAETCYKLALEKNPRNHKAWLGLAEAASLSGKDTEEERILRNAIDQGTISSAIYSRLAQISWQNGHSEECDQLMLQATQLDPSSPLAWMVWGQLYENRKMWPETLECYENALKFNPELARIQYKIGVLLMQKGDLKHAREHLESAAVQAQNQPMAQDAARLIQQIDGNQ